jgi:hypothetical protein
MSKPKWKIVNKKRQSIYAHPKSEYCREYLKGKIVEAHENSFGLYCFKTKYHAKNFLTFFPLSNYNIIKIQPLSKAKKKIGLFSTRYLKNKYKNYLKTGRISLIDAINCFPVGTICYDKIKVLE